MPTLTFSKVLDHSSRSRTITALIVAAVTLVSAVAMGANAPLAQARKIAITYHVSLSPLSANRPVGTNHTLTAYVSEETQNCDPGGSSSISPVSGTTVKFSVTSGPNAGKTGAAPTDAQGHATFTYTSAKPGLDKVVATIGMKNTGVCIADSEPDPSNTAEVNWYVSPPRITINDVTVTEGDTDLMPATPATFTVSLSHASSKPVTVDYATADGSAVMPADYVGSHETLTFAPGDPLTQNVTIQVRGDIWAEGTEWFAVNLSNAANAQIGDAQGIGTILDEDDNPVTHP